jgi:DNA-binding CsgD family transcriptional regulator
MREGAQEDDAVTMLTPQTDRSGPLSLPAVAETAEVVIEALEAPAVAAPVLEDGPGEVALDPDGLVSMDEYAKAVLYNGLGHYRAARAAAERACAHDDFTLLDGALSELVEASLRSGDRDAAEAARRRLVERASGTGSAWTTGLAACARALLAGDDDRAEACYREAVEHLERTPAQVAPARARLLYGEWLRRRGRRIDARAQLAPAHDVFVTVGLSGFAERARRELLASGRTARKRADDARLDLTAQEARIAELAAGGFTNPEIGERLFISKRTVEWHLRKVFTKLGCTSRRELHTLVPRLSPVLAPG